MTPALTPLRGKRISWTTLLGLLLVPLTVAGLFLWGLWNPSDRLETVTAAVVNEDEPVELDGQLVPLGRVLAAELISGGDSGDAVSAGSAADDARQNFTWVLTSASDARAGLDDGRFATSITIPKEFSAAATSLSAGPGQARKATIEITESDRGRLLDTALSGIVTQTATRVLNQQLGEQFVGGVFVGMSSIHDGVSEAAGGAKELAAGGTQLADGAGELADGTQQLVDGTQQLAGGAGALAGGAGGLAAGAQELSGGVAGVAQGAQGVAGGAGALAAGAQDLSGGVAEIAAGASGLAAGAAELAAGAQDAAAGGQPLAAGTREYVTGVNSIVNGVQAGVGEAVGPLQLLVDAIVAGTVPVPPEEQAKILETLNTVIAEMEKVINDDDPNNQLAAFKRQGEALAAGAEASAAGQQELAAGLAGFSGGVADLANGASQLAGGAATLAGGASELAGGTAALAEGSSALAGGASALAGGAGELSAGANELSAGVTELSAQTPQLADGAGKLAEGATASATGTKTLADGLGDAVAQIPNYTESERQVMAETAVEAVSSEGESGELFNASGVPLFAGIALWAGALAAFLVLSPLWSRTREAARGVFAITLRSALPAVLLGAAQGAIAGIVLPIALRYDFGQAAGFFGLAVLAGIAFSLVVQGLSARFGGFGRFAAFALLVVAFTVGIVSTVPGLLSAVGDASPIGAAFTGFQALAAGVSGAGGAAVLLALWGAGGAALTAWAVARERRA
ncbi:YhgE/Pip family protein [Leucobacter sp. BZR 635]